MGDLELPLVLSKRGIRKEYQDLEKGVSKWVLLESKKLGKLPTKAAIQKYAQEKYHEAGHIDFKASLGWYRRWRKRYNLKESAYSSTSTPVTVVISPNTVGEERINESHSSNGGCLSETLESFSIETDKLMSNIEMINSPSEFFDFSDSAIEMTPETGDISMKNFMKELMDDFGRYFNESDNEDRVDVEVGKRNKKSCKYDKDFKDQVISFIGKHSIMEAAAKFKIHTNTISVWMKESKFQKQLTQIIMEEATNTTLDDIKSKEIEFCEWLSEKNKSNQILSKEEVKEKLSCLRSPGWSGKNHWFAKYCCKYLNDKQSSLRGSKINYSNQFQKLITSYAKRTSQMKAASVFNLARKQLFNWVKKGTVNKKQTENELHAWYDSKLLKPAGRVIREKAKQLCGKNSDAKSLYRWYYKWCAKNNIAVRRNCDEEIVEWILAAYDKNLSVSHEDVQKKALEIYKSQNEGNFKASTGWLLRFCRRYMNVLRRIPPLTAVLPSSCEASIKMVREQILKTLEEKAISRNCFGVMDEIPLKLKPGTNNNMQKKPLLRSCGMSNIQGTVILTCLSDGAILPPVLTLKDKRMMNNLDRFSVIHQTNGIVDDDVMQFWLMNVWFRYVKHPNLLLMDCFAPHVSGCLEKKFDECNSHVVIIPAGCSSKLNPLTQIISPQFQEIIDQHCCKWFEENSLTWQMGGSGTSLSSQDIIDWVGNAYENVNNKLMQENLRNVFEKMELLLAEKYPTM